MAVIGVIEILEKNNLICLIEEDRQINFKCRFFVFTGNVCNFTIV